MITYSASILESKETKPGCWKSLTVGIFQEDTETKVGKQIGSYERNYPSLYKTFFPFKQNDKWYALYSRDYTSTRIMSLPDCKDLGGEERDNWGFCPTEFACEQSFEIFDKNGNITLEPQQEAC